MDTKALIQKNKKIFEITNAKYNIYTPKLLEFLGEQLFTAPASTTLSLYNAFEGGLMDHLIRIAKYATLLNDLLPKHIRYPKESVLKVAFLCEIGKTFLFKPCKDKWNQEHQGKVYEFVEDSIAMRVGERSLFYALSNGVVLTEEEAQAILNFDKPDTNEMVKWHAKPLTKILRTAIEFAIIEEKSMVYEQ